MSVWVDVVHSFLCSDVIIIPSLFGSHFSLLYRPAEDFDMPSQASSDLPIAQTTENGEKVVQANMEPSKKGLRFWLVILSMCTCVFLASLELCSVSTALPTIVDAMRATQFTWLGTAYALASAVFHPMSGGLAQTYGRRPALLLTIGLFALGSSICGAANSMNIAGRTIQGLGGGGIQSLTTIILSDLVTLQERGLYVGLYGIANCVAAAIGPLIGGSLATQGQWRWLFYLNLPISLVACVLAIVLLDLPTPPGSSKEKFMRLDWIGSFFVILSTVACTIGLTWGGITAPWSSVTILIPLILGFVGLVVFIAYEATYATNPLVPFSLLTNLTSISGRFAALVTVGVVYFYPVYYQACKGASPVMSSVYTLAYSAAVPSGIITGLSITATKRYRPQMWVSWVTIIIGFGLMSTILPTDSLGKSIAYFLILGLGVGVVNTGRVYPIVAPLSITQNAPALAFMWFLTAFAGVWGITIGGAVVQNELAKKLPASFIQSVPQGTAIMYVLIPQLSEYPPHTRLEVQVAFTESLAVLWQVLAGVSGMGLVASLFMKGLPLQDMLDAKWTMKNEQEDRLML
ncbi:MFS general substrate transporter [Imleria badia]|nr:MFS general substrate transporter [Imleria badia]